MRRQAIPNNQEFPREMPQQVTQEIHDLFGFDRALVHSKVEVQERDPRDRSEIVPIEMVLENGSLSLGSPGSDPVGLLRNPAFVHKHDRAPLCQRFFLSRAIASSSNGLWPSHPSPKPGPPVVGNSSPAC